MEPTEQGLDYQAILRGIVRRHKLLIIIVKKFCRPFSAVGFFVVATMANVAPSRAARRIRSTR